MLDHMLTTEVMLLEANMGVLDKLKIVAMVCRPAAASLADSRVAAQTKDQGPRAFRPRVPVHQP